MLASLVALAPAWRPSWYQDDQLPSVFRTLHTDLAHHQGVLFPRMACELGFGYGQLLHQVYPPLGFELTAWLHALGFGYIASVRAFFSLCLVTGAVGLYAYGRTVLPDRVGAVLAAVAFVWAPYVLLDAHPGGDFGESLAIALLPWSLLAFHRLVLRGGWARLAGAALGLGAVILAHNITALFFIGLVCLSVAMLAARLGARQGRRAALRAVAGSILAMLLALGLSAIYWAPAIFELSYSRIAEQREGSFSVSRYLVPPDGLLQTTPVFSYDPADQHRFGLVQLLVTLAALFLVGVALARRRAVRKNPAIVPPAGPDLFALTGCGIVFLAVLVLQLRLAQPVWDAVPLISFVQFPRRLYLFATLASALLVGSVPWALGLAGVRPPGRIAAASVGALAFGLAGLPGVYWAPRVAASHELTEDQVAVGSPADRRFSQRNAYDDFFPTWVDERQLDVPRLPIQPALYRLASDLPAPRVQLLERGYRRIRLVADAPAPAGVVVHRFYFPGWRATVDGQPTAVDPVGPLGLTRVSVPPGHHDVVITFGETALEQASASTSAASGLIVVALLWRGLGARRTLLGLSAATLTFLVPWVVHLAVSPPARLPITPLDVAVTPAARIVGAEQRKQAYAPGDTVRVTVLWQATAWSGADGQTGLRLLPLDGEAPLIERWDRPNLGRTPTPKWVLGEIVPDPISLRIPPGTAPGRYRLLAGLRSDAEASLIPIAEIVVGPQ